MRRKFINSLSIGLISILLSACASTPTQTQLAKADYGKPITQDKAQKLVKDFFSTRLKDPSSAQYQWGTVDKGWYRHSIYSGGGFIYGYLLHLKVNAKNSYGGYNGYKAYDFMFHNGTISTVYGQANTDGPVYMGQIH